MGGEYKKMKALTLQNFQNILKVYESAYISCLNFQNFQKITGAFLTPYF